MKVNPGDFCMAPLSAAMASQRLRVLDFVRTYIARWGGSPSQGEIAAALGIDRKAVWRAVRSLARDGLIRRTAGTRGLSLPEAEAEAIRHLRAMGWTIDPDQAVAAKAGLLAAPELDYPAAGKGDGGAGDGTAIGQEIAREQGP